jgi:hypothetical protein
MKKDREELEERYRVTKLMYEDRELAQAVADLHEITGGKITAAEIIEGYLDGGFIAADNLVE